MFPNYNEKNKLPRQSSVIATMADPNLQNGSTGVPNLLWDDYLLSVYEVPTIVGVSIHVAATCGRSCVRSANKILPIKGAAFTIPDDQVLAAL
jgi:hypothetical protein